MCLDPRELTACRHPSCRASGSADEFDFSDQDFPELSAEDLREIDDISSAQVFQPAHPATSSTVSSADSSSRPPPAPRPANAIAGPSSARAQPQQQRNMHVGPSRYGAPATNGRARQANLVGGYVDEDDDVQARILSQHIVTKRGKKWDRTAFAASGKRLVSQKKPGEPEPEEEGDDGAQEQDDDDGGFEQFPQTNKYMVDRKSSIKDKCRRDLDPRLIDPPDLA